MKKVISALLFYGLSLLISVNCFAGETTIVYRYADAAEASEMVLANKDYYENLSQNDINFRLQKMDGTLEELEKFAAEQTRDFTDEEKAAIDEAIHEIEKICDERGYHLPEEDGIVFAKTTMKDECDAGAYTHGTEIYLGERIVENALSDDTKEFFQEVLAHELFHCLTRNNPDFRKEMYKILDFTVREKDFEFPQEIKDRIISNPDVEHHDSTAVFRINGEDKECVVIFTTTKPFEKEGDSFFDYAMTGLVPIDDLSAVYSSEEAENFWDLFGENTDYVIDPEETLADNFSFTIIYGTDGKEYATPEIIEKIDALLKSWNSAS